MLTTEQNSEWHQEGNVAVHTQLVTEAMANYLDERAFNKESDFPFKEGFTIRDSYSPSPLISPTQVQVPS